MKKFTSVEQTMTSKIAELLRDHKEKVKRRLTSSPVGLTALKVWELNQVNMSLEADLKR